MAPRVMSGRAEGRRFFGRPEVLLEVERALDDAGSASGHGIVLVGGGGMGKSETLHEIAERARARGFRVVRGRGLPEEIAPPFALARELLASSSDIGDEESYRPVGGLGDQGFPGFFAEELEPVRPASKAASPRDNLPENLEALLSPTGRTHVEGLGAGREALRRRFVEYFLERAGDTPLAILIDDLHFADALSLDLVEALAREGRGKRLVLVASAAPDSAVPATVPSALGGLTVGGLLKQVVLRPLSVGEVGELATWLMGGSPPTTEEVLRWHTETEGNPLCVELLVRSVAGVALRRKAPSERSADVLQAVIDRARALEGVDRRVITYASVLGREFGFPRIHATIGLPEEAVSESLDRLVRDGILRERGSEVYEFVSDRIWATVYSELTETRRAILHRKVAEALETRADRTDLELARHFYLGRNDAKAVEYNLRAAEAAARAFAFETALSLVRRALEAARRPGHSDPRLEARLRTEEGRLLNEVGDFPAAETALDDAVRLARQQPEFDLGLARALLALAWTRIERSAYREAEPFALEAMGLLQRTGAPRDLLAAHRALGTLYWRLSELSAAEHHQREALAIAEKEGGLHEQGHALIDVANTLLPRGEEFVEPTLALYERAAGLFAKVDDPSASARVQMNRAVLLHRVGRTDEALHDIGLALDAAERSRSPIWIGYCLLNLAQWQAELGKTREAAEMIDRADRTVAPTGDLLARQQVQMIRGLIAEREGRLDDAERWFAESQESARAMGAQGELAEILVRRARLALRGRDPRRAREMLDAARASGVAERRADLLPEIAKVEAELPAAEPPAS